jgi:hypothetical protein
MLRFAKDFFPAFAAIGFLWKGNERFRVSYPTIESRDEYISVSANGAVMRDHAGHRICGTGAVPVLQLFPGRAGKLHMMGLLSRTAACRLNIMHEVCFCGKVEGKCKPVMPRGI